MIYISEINFNNHGFFFNDVECVAFIAMELCCFLMLLSRFKISIMEDDMNFDAFIESVDTMFYGTVSFDAWGNFQPNQNSSLAEKMMWEGIHSEDKFVFSRQNRTNEKVTFISSDIANKVAEIKNQGGKDFWLYVGADLIKTFIILGLIDVYKISVHPVAFG